MRYAATDIILRILACALNILESPTTGVAGGLVAWNIAYWERAIEAGASDLRARGLC